MRLSKAWPGTEFGVQGLGVFGVRTRSLCMGFVCVCGGGDHADMRLCIDGPMFVYACMGMWTVCDVWTYECVYAYVCWHVYGCVCLGICMYTHVGMC